MDKVLTIFLENTEKEYHVREIATLVRKSPTTISKYLKKLQQDKLLLSRRKLHHLLFKANTEHDSFIQVKIAYNLSSLRKSGLLDALTEHWNQPEAIIVFGSYAKAEDTRQSDIDLVIITPTKKDISLGHYEKKLKHPIQIFQHSAKEIQDMKKKNKELLNTFVNGIIVSGYWELF